jgi:hypothetical protein
MMKMLGNPWTWAAIAGGFAVGSAATIGTYGDTVYRISTAYGTFLNSVKNSIVGDS